jgi:hypothetical protein
VGQQCLVFEAALKVAISYPVGAKHRLDLSAAAPYNVNAINTWCAWVKRTTDTGAAQYIAQQHRDTTGGTGAERKVYIDASDAFTIDGNASGPAAATVGSWFWICYSHPTGASNAYIYYSAEGGTGDPTQGSNAGGMGGTSHAVNYITIGSYLDGGQEFRGSICCFRTWAATLSLAEMQLERDSAVAVKSGAFVDWRMATAAGTPTFSSGSYALNTTGTPTTDAAEPSNISAASTTRGMPFGNRSTAFNGGRVFTGPIY